MPEPKYSNRNRWIFCLLMSQSLLPEGGGEHTNSLKLSVIIVLGKHVCLSFQCHVISQANSYNVSGLQIACLHSCYISYKKLIYHARLFQKQCVDSGQSLHWQQSTQSIHRLYSLIIPEWLLGLPNIWATVVLLNSFFLVSFSISNHYPSQRAMN